jgi:putative intracellular protease/amidase
MRYSSLLPALAALHSTLARPTQPEISNTTTLPTHFGLVVFPHYQALDIFGPMDLLNTLFMAYRNSTVVPQFSVLSKTMDPVTSAMTAGGFGQEIMPTTTFSDYLVSCDDHMDLNTTDLRKKKRSDDDISDIDVLIVPGGGGTRRNLTEEINFIKATYPNVRNPPYCFLLTPPLTTPQLKYILSVCTGATLLSRAGILDGRRATTNKAAWTWATSTGPNVDWVPTARWVEDGNIISTSGVSAGIDGTYAFVSRVYGEAVAHFLSLQLEYNREMDAHHDPFGKVWDVPGAT